VKGKRGGVQRSAIDPSESEVSQILVLGGKRKAIRGCTENSFLESGQGGVLLSSLVAGLGIKKKLRGGRVHQSTVPPACDRNLGWGGGGVGGGGEMDSRHYHPGYKG